KPKEETARGGSLLPPFGGLQNGQEALAFLETPEGGGRDVLNERLAYRPANQGLDHRQPRAETQREPLPELPDWPSGLELPDWPSKDDLPELPQKEVPSPTIEQENATISRSIDPRDMFPKAKRVRDANLDPRITNQYETIGRIFHENGAKVVISSANDSIHSPNSLHYKNLAIDIRAKKYNRTIMLKIQNKLSKELGKDYDVLYEEYPDDPDNNHIHIEYDPKGKVMK
ncbi:hypothetical protein, partial [Desulfovibrio aminophilus]|uniref:hypothetical protein n=1 Tax=Desulfovibrio aminophilus TaxID=81425 RepID=UPI001B7F9A8E